MNVMSPNAPAHAAGTNTLSLRRNRHDHPLTCPFRMTQSLEFRLNSAFRVRSQSCCRSCFWDWLGASESDTRTKRIVDIVFGGVFRVLARHQDRYDVNLTDLGKPYIGRLKLQSSYRNRATRVNFENHYDGPHKLRVLEILREPYSGRSFPGYEHVAVSFRELEALLRIDRPDWKAALKSVKGVYLITDAKSGKQVCWIGLWRPRRLVALGRLYQLGPWWKRRAP